MNEFRPAFSYDILTPFYDLLTDLSGFGKGLKKQVVTLANIKSGDKVLDVGAGTGTFINEANKRVPNIVVTGVDPDKNVLEIARNKLRAQKVKANLVVGYAQDLPFNDSTFDIVVSTLTFHHLKTPVKKKAIEEIFRVLKSSGKFLLADFGKAAGPISYLLLNVGSVFDGGEEMRANIRGVLPKLLKKAGFKVEKIGGRYRGIEFLLARK